ncbi:MAG: 30S ribosome-binding factor RbfA [Gemmatimonadetes bacterium]|nr:30S ribosome-binding factor RbfA [Gemmatimonadota bacterium]
MPSKRIARVNEQIRRELTFLLQRDVRDPRIGVITVTAVEVSPDLYHAKVFYSVMGSDEDRDSAAEGLRAAAGYLRTEIGRRMHIRRAPELHFTYDDTQRHAMHIERLLQEALATAATTEEGVDSDADADGTPADSAGTDNTAHDADFEADTGDTGDTDDPGTGAADADEAHGRC